MIKTFEEKQKSIKEKKWEKIAAMSTIAMCEWEQYGNDFEKTGKMLYRSKVVKIGKRYITMRCLGTNNGLLTLKVKSGNIQDFVIKIEMVPCDTTEWARPDEKMKEHIRTISCTQ